MTKITTLFHFSHCLQCSIEYLLCKW